MNNSNKRIYKNTIIIYARMFIVMFIGLFSSRYVLQALGVSDFGLYNVVAGLIALLNFISTAMSTTTRRFVNTEMGKRNGNVNKVFNICYVIHVGFALFILVVVELVGIWYINNYLNVEPSKLYDALFVFNISTIVACIGVVNVPCQSLVEANERFDIAAIIDIATNLLKFALILVLIYYPGNCLRFYAVSICVVSFVSFVSYRIVCRKLWQDTVKFKWYSEKELYKEILFFNNYTAMGAIASISKKQGSNILLNFFFGTVVNAAFAIAYQVESYVYMFVSKLTIAAVPQITQSHSGGNEQRSLSLVSKMSRYSILMMTIFFFFFVIDIDYILALWLKNVPEGASLFCILTLIDCLAQSFSEGTNGYIQAAGKVKWFQILSSILLVLNIPLGFFAYKVGFPSYSIIVLFIIITIVNRIINLILMKSILNFDIWNFIQKAYLAPLAVILILALYTIFYNVFIPHQSFRLVGLLMSYIVVLVVTFYVGMNSEERRQIQSVIIKRKI